MVAIQHAEKRMQYKLFFTKQGCILVLFIAPTRFLARQNIEENPVSDIVERSFAMLRKLYFAVFMV